MGVGVAVVEVAELGRRKGSAVAATIQTGTTGRDRVRPGR